MLPITELHSHPSATVESLYEAYHGPVLAHLTRLVDDRSTAEDLCQETFLKALRGWARHDPAASPVAWLYRIATNTAYDHLRDPKQAARYYHQFLDVADGKYPDQEWQAKHRLIAIEPKK